MNAAAFGGGGGGSGGGAGGCHTAISVWHALLRNKIMNVK
jgi:hypothetical protein